MKHIISNLRQISILVVLTITMSIHGDTTARISLQLDGWKQLSKSDIEQLSFTKMPDSGSFWRNQDSGTMLIFSEHATNKTTQDIKAAIAGICDSAMNRGISPESVELITIWTLPAFKMSGTMKLPETTIRTTFIYAIGESASYQAILFEYKDKASLKADDLVEINDNVNPKGKEALAEIIEILIPNLPMMRAYADEQRK